jgi:hypothetical protein
MRRTKPPIGCMLNRDHPLARGLVGCFLFPRSVNLVTGTAVTPVSGPATVATDRGAAARLTGTEYYTCGNEPGYNQANATNGLTVEGWVKPSATTARQFFVTKGDDIWGLMVTKAGTDTPVFYAQNTAVSYGEATAATSIVAGRWYHLVGVVELDGWIRLYMDGALAASVSLGTLNTVSGQPLVIGAHAQVPSLQKTLGDVWLARLWARPLTATDIRSLYNQPLAMLDDPWLRWYGALTADAPPAAAAGFMTTMTSYWGVP